MFLPTALTFLVEVAVFWLASTPVQTDASEKLDAIRAHFTMSPWLFLPLAVVAVLAVLRVSPVITIMSGALTGAGVAAVFAPGRIARFADPDSALPGALAVVKGLWLVLASGYNSSMGVPTLDTLVSRGGMDSMLPTVWLIMAALAFGGVVEKAGVLDRLIAPVLAMATSAARLVGAVIGAVFGANIITADQYMAIVLPARMFRPAMERLGFDDIVLSRTVAASATPSSALVPWNSCGAFMSAALGVSTLQYAPLAVFNYGLPLVVLLLATAGIGVPRRQGQDRATGADNS